MYSIHVIPWYFYYGSLYDETYASFYFNFTISKWTNWQNFFPLGLNIAAKAYTEALLRLGQTARTTCSGGTEEIGKSFVLALCIGLVSDFWEVCSNLKTGMENAHLILNCFTKIILWHLSTFFWHLLIFFSLHIYSTEFSLTYVIQYNLKLLIHEWDGFSNDVN